MTELSRQQRIEQVLGQPALGRLRDRLKARLRSGRSLEGSVTLRDASADERAALAAILGQTISTAAHLTLRLDRLEAALKQGGLCESLHDALIAIEGPVRNDRQHEQQLREQWARLVHDAGESHGNKGDTLRWLTDEHTVRLLRRLAQGDVATGRTLLNLALAVLAHLPHAGITRAVLAAQVAGDSHALDPGQPVATLVTSALAAKATQAVAVTGSHGDGDDDEAGSVRSPEDRRALWEQAGVFDNDLTRAVLVVNLACTSAGLISQVINDFAAAGEPCYLTLRSMLREGPAYACRDVYVCENPAVLAVAASRLAAACPPMVCVSGQPGSAATQLLALLTRSGATLHYHGDFDWPGLRIANRVMRMHDARAWRMSAEDYEVAADRAQAMTPLDGPRVEAAWDSRLAQAMAARGVAVHEEMVVETLLGDLLKARAGG